MDHIAFLETLAVMVISATVLILLLRRLRLPTIVLCIAAGLAIGPLLGIVSFDEVAPQAAAWFRTEADLDDRLAAARARRLHAHASECNVLPPVASRGGARCVRPLRIV